MSCLVEVTHYSNLSFPSDLVIDFNVQEEFLLRPKGHSGLHVEADLGSKESIQ